jgi:5S rRNA maturation endonuclease (ribonuclease M5)
LTCSEFLAQLDDMLDEKATGSLRSDLEQHLRECEHCVITLNTTRKTIEIYRSHEIYELPDELRKRLQNAILAKCKKC